MQTCSVMQTCLLTSLFMSVSCLNSVNYEFNALDCRMPKGIMRSKVTALCEHKTQTKERKEVVHVLQYDKTQVLEVITCSLQKTRLLVYCGSFSHTKLFEPPDILQSDQVNKDVCLKAYKTSLYVQEDKKTSTVSVNQPLVYKYINHGAITTSASNVRCEGESFTIHGKLKANMLEMITAKFVMQIGKIEYHPEKGVKDLSNDWELPRHCIPDRYCHIYGKTYVVLSPRDMCPLYLIRSLEMTHISYIGVDNKRHDALLSHEHQLILEKGGVFHTPETCKMLKTVYNTNYGQIKVVMDVRLTGVMESLPAYTLDINLQTQVLHDYANYRAETLISSRIDSTLHDLCKTNQFGLHDIERDPFKKDFLIKRTGEVFTRFHCSPVTVTARKGDHVDKKCWDALPVFLGRTRLFLLANSRLLLEAKDVKAEQCSDRFAPVYWSIKGQAIIANPEVKFVNVTLSEVGMSLYTQHVQNKHETAQHFALYTEQEIKDFIFLIHFGRTQKGVLTSLTEKYCNSKELWVD